MSKRHWRPTRSRAASTSLTVPPRPFDKSAGGAAPTRSCGRGEVLPTRSEQSLLPMRYRLAVARSECAQSLTKLAGHHVHRLRKHHRVSDTRIVNPHERIVPSSAWRARPAARATTSSRVARGFQGQPGRGRRESTAPPPPRDQA